MESWKEMLNEISKDDEIIACTLDDEELAVIFDSGYGSHEGKAFTAWGKKYVYFPVVYDGSEWIEKVPRSPCNESTYHVGGQ